jgi:hypothetical protein
MQPKTVGLRWISIPRSKRPRLSLYWEPTSEARRRVLG